MKYSIRKLGPLPIFLKLKELLTSNFFTSISANKKIPKLYHILVLIDRIIEDDSFTKKEIQIPNNIYRLYEDLQTHRVTARFDGAKNLFNQKAIYSLLEDLEKELDYFTHSILPTSFNQVYNSDTYYVQQIDELLEQKKEYENAIKRQETLQGATEDEIAVHKHNLKEKEASLAKASDQINAYRKELEEKKKERKHYKRMGQ
ncbi:MAG: hypothetical protein AB8F78_09445 [Saprospiraceae bacterium]